MTESEWLAAADPEPMLEYLRSPEGGTSDRKLRLFACACCRQVWHLLPDKDSRAAVEVAERYADGRTTRRELAFAGAAAIRSTGRRRGAAWAAYWATRFRPGESIWNVHSASAGAAVDAAMRAAVGDARAWDAAAYDAATAASARAQADLVHEVFGNPFRPSTVDPAWLTWHRGTVRGLAETAYEECAFELLPVLGDALQEAGCADAAILEHCRQAGSHVRGCWMLDLLLDKG